MKNFVGFTLGCLFAFLSSGITPLMAQDAAVNELVITGTVKNKDSRKKLENVNVSVVGNNIGTVTNADGTFSLKVAEAEAFRGLEVSHIGYLTTHLSLEELEKTGGLTIWMIPAPNLLSEIVVYGNNPRVIVEEAIKKIPVNYSGNDNMLTAFYRETVQKRRRYISVSEAVMDVYKTDYNSRDVDRDKVQLLKGRRLLSQKQSDTLAVKVVGGPNLSLYLDIVKNGDALLSTDNLDYYEFRMEDPVNLDNRMQYVVSFRPRVSLMYALFIGKLYIDYERLSFTRAEFGLDMANRVKAVEAILHKKPVGLRFRPQEVTYLVTYKQQGAKTYLNYIRNVIRFKCDWKKRLFSSSYTAFSEMVVTDRTESPLSGISNKNTFKRKQVFYDLVDGIFRRYYSPLCWYAAGITGDTASAEEIVEELFYVLWKNRERLQVFQSVKSYLYRSVRNEAVQFCEHQEVKERYRASVRTESGPGYSSDPHAHLEYEELRTLIRHTLDKQPRRRQQIFRMHRMEGKKYAEIALSLSLSVKTVEAEMTKVLRTLRNEIDNYIRTQ